MSLEQIDFFIRESIAKGIKWDRIRLLGGEPTLHPKFSAIIELLIDYRSKFSPTTIIQVCTNGYGKKVESLLAKIPTGIEIENTKKDPDTQPAFDTFNVAPRDLKAYRHSDFRNGCWITKTCGIGLSASGFYPCAVAAGIDRIVGWNLGRQSIPDDNDMMHDMLERFCSHCGHFKRRRDPPVTHPAMSATWVDAYQRGRKGRLSEYGSKAPGVKSAISTKSLPSNKQPSSENAVIKGEAEPSAGFLIH